MNPVKKKTESGYELVIRAFVECSPEDVDAMRSAADDMNEATRICGELLGRVEVKRKYHHRRPVDVAIPAAPSEREDAAGQP